VNTNAAPAVAKLKSHGDFLKGSNLLNTVLLERRRGDCMQG
jgi:hypothetical protein